MMRLIKQNWFLIALAGICVVTLIDVTGTIAGMGKWFKSHSGADAVICTIFFCSGLILKREEIRAGLRDTRGAVIALVIIFTIAPLAAYVIGKLPLDPAVRIGLFLVSVMPTTMSSGVVMTGAAGGNIAHALLITVLANSLSIVTIPFSLALLLQTVDSVPIDKARMMIQMALLVLLPLLLGLFLRPKKGALLTLTPAGHPCAKSVPDPEHRVDGAFRGKRHGAQRWGADPGHPCARFFLPRDSSCRRVPIDPFVSHPAGTTGEHPVHGRAEDLASLRAPSGQAFSPVRPGPRLLRVPSLHSPDDGRVLGGTTEQNEKALAGC